MSTTVSPGQSVSTSNYQDYVNPRWVSLLDLLGMNVEYERCLGTELFAKDGRRFLDFLSGYRVHNTGHNHPDIIQALKDEMDRCGPTMLQSHVPEIAGELAQRLCELAGGDLQKVFFGSSGSEGVEAAMKFARATTGRPSIVYAKSSFHGLTNGALSLMDDAFWREGFGPLLPDTVGVPFGDIDALEKCARQQTSCCFFIVEPLAGRRWYQSSFARVPCKRLRTRCRRTGTLSLSTKCRPECIAQEPSSPAHQFDVQPEMVVLAKALSGGLMPISAVRRTDKI